VAAGCSWCPFFVLVLVLEPRREGKLFLVRILSSFPQQVDTSPISIDVFEERVPDMIEDEDEDEMD
jgi:hypothetical protein